MLGPADTPMTLDMCTNLLVSDVGSFSFFQQHLSFIMLQTCFPDQPVYWHLREAVLWPDDSPLIAELACEAIQVVDILLGPHDHLEGWN